MASEQAPAFQFYPKDFLSSSKVQTMKLEQRGAYITLLSFQWLDGSLPTDHGALARLLSLSPRAFKAIWDGVGQCFIERDGRLFNERLERSRSERQAYTDGAARGGRKSAEARRAKYGSAQPKPLRSGFEAQPEVTSNGQFDKPPEVTPNTASASASASPSTTPSVSVPRERRTVLVQRRRPDAAFEFGRLYVPQRAHADLLAIGNHDGGEPALLAWYERVSQDWTEGTRRADRVDPDMIRFWKARYAEAWPPTPVAAPTAAKPGAMPVYRGWECPHVEPCTDRGWCEQRQLLPEKYPQRSTAAPGADSASTVGSAPSAEAVV